MIISAGRVGLGDVADIKDRLRGQQVESLQDCEVLGCDAVQKQPDRLAVLEQCQCLLHHGKHGHGFLFLAGGPLAHLDDTPFQALEIRQHQFGFDRFGVRHRVDAAFDMGDVVILEAAQYVHDGVDLADIGEELVAEAFALRCAAHQPRDIDEGNACGDDLLGLGDARNILEARVRHGDFAGIRLDGAERIVRGLCRGGLCQGVEKRRLADIGQADDAAFETHDAFVPSAFEELRRAMGNATRRVKAGSALQSCAGSLKGGPAQSGQGGRVQSPAPRRRSHRPGSSSARSRDAARSRNAPARR